MMSHYIKNKTIFSLKYIKKKYYARLLEHK